MDDQSNVSFVMPSLIQKLGASGPTVNYKLTTCSGVNSCSGRKISQVVVESLDGEVRQKLPPLLEMENLPDDLTEIPTPEAASAWKHLRVLADKIPPLQADSCVEILVGRDAPRLHKVRKSINGPNSAPWAQKLDLGWVIMGQVCLSDYPSPVRAVARKSVVTDRDQCSSHMITEMELPQSCDGLSLAANTDENRTSPSIEDKIFLEIMERGVHVNDDGFLELPLPLRDETQSVPSTLKTAEGRLKSLRRNFDRDPQMNDEYFSFMGKLMESGHAEEVPTDEIQNDNWYIPHFAVYNPRKPGSIRVVFDASAKTDSVSLNRLLYPGPDQAYSLLGVLQRFRRHAVAVTCDVEHMFHCFYVNPEHRDWLRFLWFHGNQADSEITPHRMKVHIFGSTSSPAVATFGLRKIASDGAAKYGCETASFIHRNFYVDDGLISVSSSSQVISLIDKTQQILSDRNLRLHKIASNSLEVMSSVAAEDRASSLRQFDVHRDPLPEQQSLGLLWNIDIDAFTIKVVKPEKPFTRRGMMSTVFSVFDPLGIAAPVVIVGRIMLQQIVAMNRATKEPVIDWDDPLPKELWAKWFNWCGDLHLPEGVQVPRCYVPSGFGPVTRRELHAFSDASQKGLGQVTFLRSISNSGQINVSFVTGKARVAPLKVVSIPRLELTAAALSVDVVASIIRELDLYVDAVYYCSDSRVVLSYIANDSRRFEVFVANRVQRIRVLSSPTQWFYVASERNLADLEFSLDENDPEVKKSVRVLQRKSVPRGDISRAG